MTTNESDHDYLSYIEVAAGECLEFVGNTSFGEFLNDRKTRAAAVWQICVIGEVANRIEPDIQQQAPEVNWRRMTDMRNVLIHKFHEIDYEIVWQTVQEHLPPLIASIRRLRDNLNSGLR